MRMKAVLSMLVLSVLLCACGGDDTKVIEGEVQNAVTQTVSVEEETTEEQQESAEYKGYAFISNGVVMEMDAPAAPVIEALGEAVSYFEAPSCAFEGIDKMYTYNGFEVDTYPMEEADYISTVIIIDDSVTTAEGIGIGDSVEKLIQVYGEADSNDGGMMVYEKDGMKLCFIIQEDSIESIEYRSTVLDE